MVTARQSSTAMLAPTRFADRLDLSEPALLRVTPARLEREVLEAGLR